MGVDAPSCRDAYLHRAVVQKDRSMTMEKFLSLLFVICLSVALQILVMIFGWGLHPKSWWWIIGCGVIGVTFVKMLGDRLMNGDKSSK
jgi:hypothetical protein